jgi:hypothetical protein
LHDRPVDGSDGLGPRRCETVDEVVKEPDRSRGDPEAAPEGVGQFTVAVSRMRMRGAVAGVAERDRA